jgi:hypothetical protein
MSPHENKWHFVYSMTHKIGYDLNSMKEKEKSFTMGKNLIQFH